MTTERSGGTGRKPGICCGAHETDQMEEKKNVGL